MRSEKRGPLADDRRHRVKSAPTPRGVRWVSGLLVLSGLVTGSFIWGGTALGLRSTTKSEASAGTFSEPDAILSARTLKKHAQHRRHEVSRGVKSRQRSHPKGNHGCVSNCPDRFAILPGQEFVEKPTPAELAKKAEVKAQTGPMGSFLVASFNILGSQHTTGSHDGFGSGTSRAAAATGVITSRGVSIVGFSEMQTDQLAVFRNNAPSYATYPGTSLGSAGVPTNLAWDTRVWTLEEARTFTITFSHQRRPQPVVKLKSVATGAELWVVNVHNSPQGMQAERDVAMGVEIGVINSLTATGVPVVVTGDFNEKAEALCGITSHTSLESAVGGSGCSPIRGARVDWIFRSPELSVESYVDDRSAPIPSITDHAVMFARLSRS